MWSVKVSSDVCNESDWLGADRNYRICGLSTAESHEAEELHEHTIGG